MNYVRGNVCVTRNDFLIISVTECEKRTRVSTRWTPSIGVHTSNPVVNVDALNLAKSQSNRRECWNDNHSNIWTSDLPGGERIRLKNRITQQIDHLLGYHILKSQQHLKEVRTPLRYQTTQQRKANSYIYLPFCLAEWPCKGRVALAGATRLSYTRKNWSDCCNIVRRTTSGQYCYQGWTAWFIVRFT